MAGTQVATVAKHGIGVREYHRIKVNLAAVLALSFIVAGIDAFGPRHIGTDGLKSVVCTP